MEIQALPLRVTFLLQKSLGIWLAAWAIRYKAGWDYRLSHTAKIVRWIVVGSGYVLAASLPGPGIVRLAAGFAGISFLCWPNLAYHLTNLFIDWPTIEGRVVSVAQLDLHPVISYVFEIRGETYGGTATPKVSHANASYLEGESVTVYYDPLNPDRSRVLPRIGTNPR
jgi:hypothetical protein